MPTILYIQDTNPSGYPPLERSASMLADRGWRVYFLGAHTSGAADTLTMPPHANIDIRLLERHRSRLSRPASYAHFVTETRATIHRLNPDVVYCSDLRSYLPGLMASYHPGIKTVLHEHDTPPIAGSLTNSMMGRIRRRFAQRATACVVPQDDRARAFTAITGRAPVVAYNCPSRRAIVRPPTAPQSSNFTLWYHGSINPGRLPLALVHALAQLPGDVSIAFAGYETVSSQGYIDSLLTVARDVGVGDRVAFKGVLQLADLMEKAANCQAGLCLFATDFREPMAGASNKPFDYLSCGLPLLTNATPEWEQFFGAKGVSIGCNPASPESIAKAVRVLYDDPARRHAMAERGYQLITDEWNYETQFAKVLAALDDKTPPYTAARRNTT